MAERTAAWKSPRCRLSFSEWAAERGSSTPTSSAGTPPSAFTKGSTKPMLPPQPMASGSRPKPFSSARKAAAKAGWETSVFQAGPWLWMWTFTSTPHGARERMASSRRRPTSAGSMSGTSRMPRRAQATSFTMLRASFRLEAWKAFTPSAGCHQFVSSGWAPPSISTPGRIPAWRRNSSRDTGSSSMERFSAALSGRTLS